MRLSEFVERIMVSHINLQNPPSKVGRPIKFETAYVVDRILGVVRK